MDNETQIKKRKLQTETMEANGVIFVVPFFGQGHLFPAMELCKNISTDHHYSVTLIIPSHLSSSIPSTFSDNSPFIHVTEISVAASPTPETADEPGSEKEDRPSGPKGNPLQEQNLQMGKGIKSFLSTRSGVRPTCVVVDNMMSWCKEIFADLGISVVSFSTSGATASAMGHGMWKAEVGNMKPGEIREIPGLPKEMFVTFADLSRGPRRRRQRRNQPPGDSANQDGSTGPPHRMRSGPRHGPRGGGGGGSAGPGDKPRWVDEVAGSAALLINTCDNLERVFIEYMAEQTKLPVWGVGPLLPEQFWKSAGSILHDHEMRSNHKSNYTEDEVFQWLESKPHESVIYISFGSEVGPTQLKNTKMFSMKQKKGNSPGEPIDITVLQYYADYHKIQLEYSADCPCLDVGKPKRPVYIPLELCDLISLQRYTKSLSNLQRASLVEKSRQKPQDRMRALTGALRQSNYDADPLINATGITISTTFTQVEGRVLEPPKLKFGRGSGDMVPRGGRWNFNNKTLVEPTKISCWVVVNFSARCDMNALKNNLRVCSQSKGIELDPPFGVIEENPQCRRSPAPVRVEKMFETIRQRLPGPPSFILCILPERKNSDIYGPWKRKCLVDLGIVTQCIAPTRINDQYVTNMLLKVNAKMGGINSLLSMELSNTIPLVSRTPTIIFGMDVSHGSPGRADVPSIAAVVSSRKWPQISRYRASVRAQSARVEMIDGLFKPISHDKDEGMIRELLDDFYLSTPKLKPKNIIIFRDGVSESQFNQVLNIELNQIIEACKFLDEQWDPKFLVIVAQKTHHTKFFQTNSEANVPPGTVVDDKVCHPKSNDFYLCAQNGPIGTTRPTHYHVLVDEIGFSADELQELVHSLSYVYQRSTTAISVVAPICYAHLAAAQVAQFVKFDDMSDTASSHSGGGFTQLPKLHKNVSSSMFFC